MEPSDDLSLDNQPMSTENQPSISPTSNMSALPFLESDNVSTATTDVSPVALAQTSVLATSSSIPMVLTTNSEDLVSQSVSSALQKRYALPGEKIPKLTKSPTRALVIKITNILMMKDCPFTFVDVVPTDVEDSLLNLFQSRHFMNLQLRKECIQWKTWTLDKFVELRFAVPDTKVSRPYSSETYDELVAKQNIQFDLEDEIYEINLDNSLIAIQNKFPDVTPEEDLKATRLLISRLPEQPVNWQALIYRPFNGEVPVIITVDDFRFVLRAQIKR
jgi:hypothetical protein